MRFGKIEVDVSEVDFFVEKVLIMKQIISKWLYASPGKQYDGAVEYGMLRYKSVRSDDADRTAEHLPEFRIPI